MDTIDRPQRRQTREGFAEGFTRWLAEARAGSPAALGELLEPLRRYLLSVAQAELDDRLRVKIDAADAVQETFLQAQRVIQQFAGHTEEEWRGWLRHILLNEIAQAARHCHSAKCEIRREVALPDGGSSDGGRQLAGPEETPSKRAVANENRLRLAQARERLPVDQRQIMSCATPGCRSSRSDS